ncbi:DUF1501 domain-containing protein [Mycetohabitans endofungorum]|uniref:DUF1501 domain-containing protein n=1 Tax=Mycetohabitans endofungorum TaxID=417203 RepID=UPI002B056A70|nr:DUF1501 domain-containing protein [Mycetohabitans endofungorum]
MHRRQFLTVGGAALCALSVPGSTGLLAARAPHAMVAALGREAPVHRMTLILIELSGGNDALNTVIPYEDPRYRQLRPTIGIARERVIPLNGGTGLHPSLAALKPWWDDASLAIVQGVGYPRPNLSHYRSREIWETASASHEYWHDGWLARAFAPSAEQPPSPVQSPSPLPAQLPFRLPRRGPSPEYGDRGYQFATRFARDAFGVAISHAMQRLALARHNPTHAPSVIRLTLSGFDTHHNQPARHAALLAQLADGMVALRGALTELGCWESALIMTYAEFGRRADENADGGTEHGTVAAHFVAGGRVRGGFYGVAPQLSQLDGDGYLPLGIDFRSLYATVLQQGWGIEAAPVLGARFDTLPGLLR